MVSTLMRDIGEGFDAEADGLIRIEGEGLLAAYFEVTPLAAASIGMAGAMLARLVQCNRSDPPPVIVDQRLASLWFHLSLHPQGWSLPPIWDAVAGDYPTKDGWIRLHTNAPHHRERALSVLDVDADRAAVAEAVSGWSGEVLESAIVEAGGCAASMRSLECWADHPQGQAVAKEPLVVWNEHPPVPLAPKPVDAARPLGGLRVLDLTRVLAGPAATRFLAAFGADVLRIDPPGWEEAPAMQEMTLGKRCARLDLRSGDDRAVFEGLLQAADVLVHGYRADALARLGLGPDARRRHNPGLIDVSLNAYGWSGPWQARRGFDSLVQMSCGIADFGMKQAGADKPFPLPAQALDHATGYLMAAAVLRALILRQTQGRVVAARLSLARTAHLLAAHRRDQPSEGVPPVMPADLDPWVENTVWGEARRLRFPIKIGDLSSTWRHPAGLFGASPAAWCEA